MTLTDLINLTDPALDELAAGCMGWHVGDIAASEYAHCYYDKNHKQIMDFIDWTPSSYLPQASLLEAEIARRKLTWKYAAAMIVEIESFHWEECLKDLHWGLLNASARLRTIVAIYILTTKSS